MTPMRARLADYARYQLGDYLLQRAAIALILIGFVGFFPLYPMSRGTPPDFFTTPSGIKAAQTLYMSTVVLFLPLGAFLATSAFISSDRHQGYFRFLFSKPLNLVAYYSQAYVISMAGYIALFGLLTWIWGMLTHHQSIHRGMEAAALTFMLIGGIALIFNAITRFDGVCTAVTYMLTMTLQMIALGPSMQTHGGLPEWLFQLQRVLPPIYQLDKVRNALYTGDALVMADVWHVVLYSIGMTVVGLLLLRRAPLSR